MDEVKNMTNEILNQAEAFTKGTRGFVDREYRTVVIPLCKGATVEDLFNEMGLATWFINHGFAVTVTREDFQYWVNGRDWRKGHGAFLRNRLVLRARW